MRFLRPQDLSVNRVIDLEGIGMTAEEYCWEKNEELVEQAVGRHHEVALSIALVAILILPMAAIMYFGTDWLSVLYPIGLLSLYFTAQKISERRRKQLRAELKAFYEAQEIEADR